jgi:hypothetical protein
MTDPAPERMNPHITEVVLSPTLTIGPLGHEQVVRHPHLHGGPDQLATLVEAARQAYRESWPTGHLDGSEVGRKRS